MGDYRKVVTSAPPDPSDHTTSSSNSNSRNGHSSYLLADSDVDGSGEEDEDGTTEYRAAYGSGRGRSSSNSALFAQPHVASHLLSSPAADGGASAGLKRKRGRTEGAGGHPRRVLESSRTRSGSGSPDGRGAPNGKGAPIYACVVTLTNTLLGVGIVGVAGGFTQAGWLVGTLLFLSFGCFSAVGLHLLAACARKVGVYPSGFYVVARQAVPRWTFLIDLAVAVKCFGVATSYLIVVGDLMPDVMRDVLGVEEETGSERLLSRHFWITVGTVFVTPMAFAHNLSSLKWTATLAILFAFFLVGLVLAYAVLPGMDPCPEMAADGFSFLGMDMGIGTGDGTAAAGEGAPTWGDAVLAAASSVAAGMAGVADQEGLRVGEDEAVSGSLLEEQDLGMQQQQQQQQRQEQGQDQGQRYGQGRGKCFGGSRASGDPVSVLSVLSIFVFAFTCHQNVFSIVNELERPTPRRVNTVIGASICTAVVTYLTLSWAAYSTWGVATNDDILRNYPESTLITVARVCITLLVAFCYPLQALPSRKSILSMWDASEGRVLRGAGAGAGGAVGDSATSATETSLSVSPSVREGWSRRPQGAGGGASRSGYHQEGDGDSQSDSFSYSDSDDEDEGEGGRLSGDEEKGRRRAEGGEGGGEGFRVEEEEEEADGDDLSPLVARAMGKSDCGMAANGGGEGGATPRGLAYDAVTAAEEEEAAGAAAVGDTAETETDAEGAPPSPVLLGAGGRHALVTLSFLCLSYLIAMTVSDLGVVLQVVGATGSTMISFILPGLIYLRLHELPEQQQQLVVQSDWKRQLAALQLGMGCLIMPLSLCVILFLGGAG